MKRTFSYKNILSYIFQFFFPKSLFLLAVIIILLLIGFDILLLCKWNWSAYYSQAKINFMPIFNSIVKFSSIFLCFLTFSHFCSQIYRILIENQNPFQNCDNNALFSIVESAIISYPSSVVTYLMNVAKAKILYLA